MRKEVIEMASRPTMKGGWITWTYQTKAAADKNAKDMKKAGAKNVKVEKVKDKLGRTYYKLSAKV